MKPKRPKWRHADIAPLRVRYAELLRLREYVQRLEGLRQDTALSTNAAPFRGKQPRAHPDGSAPPDHSTALALLPEARAPN